MIVSCHLGAGIKGVYHHTQLYVFEHFQFLSIFSVLGMHRLVLTLFLIALSYMILQGLLRAESIDQQWNAYLACVVSQSPHYY